MALKIVGAGLGRTGTKSLKDALELLLGAPCYHMLEVFGRPDHADLWRKAAEGEMPDWDALFDGYEAAVDWPAAAFWREISDAYPDAPVLLSVRDSSEAWWRSADRTIFEVMRRPMDPSPWTEMVQALFAERFVLPVEKQPAIEFYERHNEEVRRTIPASRLVEWKPGDGWEPVCDMVGVPVPDEPFPLTNTTEEFRAMAGIDASATGES